MNTIKSFDYEYFDTFHLNKLHNEKDNINKLNIIKLDPKLKFYKIEKQTQQELEQLNNFSKLIKWN